MAIRYSKEVHDYIKANVVGKSAKELAEITNQKFGTEFTPESMKSYKKNHKLKSGTTGGVPKGTPSKEFPEEIAKYIREKYYGIGPTEMTQILNRTFGTNYTKNQLRAYYKNHALNSGLDGRFQKGHIPDNKGVKGVWDPRCEKTWFKPGHVPVNAAEVGEERYRPKDGYVWIKVGQPNRWRMKQLVVWEQTYGKIPKGKCLIFLDGNTQNTDLSNLRLVDRSTNLILNGRNLRSDSPEYTEAGIGVAELIRKTNQLKRGTLK